MSHKSNLCNFKRLDLLYYQIKYNDYTSKLSINMRPTISYHQFVYIKIQRQLTEVLLVELAKI